MPTEKELANRKATIERVFKAILEITGREPHGGEDLGHHDLKRAFRKIWRKEISNRLKDFPDL